MRSTRLSVPKSELADALRTLSANRKQRITSRVPIVLQFNSREGRLTIGEFGALLSATVPASGDWPPAGATVTLGLLRRAIQHVADNEIELHALDGAIIVLTAHGHVSLKLLHPGSGPTGQRKAALPAGIKLRLPCSCVDNEDLLAWSGLRSETTCCRGFVDRPSEDRPLCADFKQELEVYRFFWESAFDARAVVRIAKERSRVTMRASHRLGLFNPTSAYNEPNLLTARDWEELRAALAFSGFWMLPRHPWPEHQGLDGATWTIEGRRGESYNCVDCWSPRPGPFHDAGILFLELAKLNVIV
jgi:hypothetical protein